MNKTVAVCAALGACLFVLVGLHAGDGGLALARLAVCGGALAAIARTDLREHRIPNRIVLPASAACALLAGPRTLDQGLPALALAGILLALSVAQPAALGMGDVKGALLVAVALGAAAVFALVLGLALAAVGGIAITMRHGRTAFAAALPLAPFLATGALIALATT